MPKVSATARRGCEMTWTSSAVVLAAAERATIRTFDMLLENSMAQAAAQTSVSGSQQIRRPCIAAVGEIQESAVPIPLSCLCH